MTTKNSPRVKGCSFVLFRLQFFQKDGRHSANSAMISKRHASMRSDMIHLPDDDRKSYEPVIPVTPAPKPLFEVQENDEKNASTMGNPWKTSTTPPTTISMV